MALHNIKSRNLETLTARPGDVVYVSDKQQVFYVLPSGEKMLLPGGTVRETVPVAGPAGRDGQSIVGPRGERGEKGECGPIGPRGEIGPAGRDGKSIIGPPGEKGDTGPAGRDGIIRVALNLEAEARLDELEKKLDALLSATWKNKEYVAFIRKQALDHIAQLRAEGKIR